MDDSSQSYRVIKIPSDDAIIINAGSNFDVKQGDQFKICGKSIQIKDPETGEFLGELPMIKATVEAVFVLPKMCLCKNAEYNSILSFSISPDRRRSLNVDMNEITEDFAERQKVIRVGDKAIYH